MKVTATAQCPYCGTQDFEFQFGILHCTKCGEDLTIDTVNLKVTDEQNNEVCVMTHGEDDE